MLRLRHIYWPLALATVVGFGFAVFMIPADAATTDPVGKVVPPKVRVLTEAQYQNSIAAIFGRGVEVSAHLPPLRRVKGGLLAVGTTTVGVSASDAESLHRTAYAIANQVMSPAQRELLVPCRPANLNGEDSVCAERFLKLVGRLLFRRPLVDTELREAVAIAASAAATQKDFYRGLSFSLAGMLASPKFLFVIEEPEPDPTSRGAYRLTALSLATRLSLFLWNSGPDDQLLKAAENDSLQDPKVLEKQVNEMISSPRFESGVRALYGDMLAFEEYTSLTKDPAVYAKYNGAVSREAAEQTLRVLVDHVIAKNQDYRDVFTTRTTFLTPSLATLYGVAAPSAVGWAHYELPPENVRQGLLMQIGFLSVNSHPNRSSATRRGRALRELLLCQIVPDPPANVDFSIVEDREAKFKTARERLDLHRRNPVCAGCHRLTDPIGLSLENFDGAGEFRLTEKGAPIDVSGELNGVRYQDAAGLAQIIHDDPSATNCMVDRAFAYSVGRGTTPEDGDLLHVLRAGFANDGYRVRDLIHAIAISRAFRVVAEVPQD